MAKKDGESLICRLTTAVAASLCFTTLALPSSQMRLPRRTKLVAAAKIVPVSLKQSPRLNVAVNPPSQQAEDFDARLQSGRDVRPVGARVSGQQLAQHLHLVQVAVARDHQLVLPR